MEIPIYIDGAPAGTLTMEKRGAFVWLQGDMADPGRLVRLYIYGEREAYLGVPLPEDGRLRLLRRLSPTEAARLPRRAEYVAETRLEKETPPEPGGKRHVLWHGGRPHFF